jgi:hypothetical protein
VILTIAETKLSESFKVELNSLKGGKLVVTIEPSEKLSKFTVTNCEPTGLYKTTGGEDS